jgi:hypothetical protein
MIYAIEHNILQGSHKVYVPDAPSIEPKYFKTKNEAIDYVISEILHIADYHSNMRERLSKQASEWLKKKDEYTK